ncbi:PTS sugar transporter subunit IIC [uncultured Enorma sp.]|uniref:PTS sugar transporter subunit IIC n=1 Tax=uncultured Enorma sp. TaxID=1714346 RepID=UPI00259A2F87|nr:PTS transporter subunit EIIC [uncultured Enorma sp.]
MANINDFIEEKLMPIAGRIAANRVLVAIRDGLALAMPLIIIGSLLTVISSFPVEAWTAMLDETGVSGYLSKVTNASFGIMALIASFGVANSYAKQRGVNGAAAGAISLSSLLVVTPNLFTEAGDEGIPMGYLGSKGLFLAIVVGVVSAMIFQWFINHDIRIKMPDGVPPAVADSFSALIPGAVILFMWGIIYAVANMCGITNLHDVVTTVLGVPLGLVGATLPGTVVVVMLNSFFWFFGINGGSITSAVFKPVWLANAEANVQALQAGDPLPNIITKPFMDNFVYIGGGGAILGLIVVIALIALRKNSSKLTKTMVPLTLVPGCFNVSEPAMFGIPVVLNIKLLIPFMVAPAVNVIVCYLAMASGLVPLTTGVVVTWTVPIIISGILTTNSIAGAVLQVVCLALDVLIYLPFYLMVEKQNLIDEASEASQDA